MAAEQPEDRRQVKSRVFNYYFLFLVLLMAVLAALLCFLHRQRRLEQEQIALRGHNALARDVEHLAMDRRDRLHAVEGLNEVGEAPPPYKSKDANIATRDPINGNTMPNDGVTVPPRVLTLHEIEHARLPDYFETMRIHNGPNTALPRSMAEQDLPRTG